jgi:hypothetical protein
MKTEPMTPAEFDEALAALAWKGTDFCDRAGLVPNTIWRWRKGLVEIPRWVREYLRAMLAVQRLHSEFVAVSRGAERDAVPSTSSAELGAESSAAEVVNT